jgi:hypothetical protein
MSTRILPESSARLVRKSILSVLIGMMGGASCVLAQRALGSNPPAATVSDADLTTAAAPSATAASATPPAATVAGADAKPPAPTLVAKKAKKKKDKQPKLTPVNIVQGTLTVDGWTGKARMNYDIADLKFIYMWAPGLGTVVVSNVKFPLGKEEPNAFAGNTLRVDVDGHTLELYSQKSLLKNKKPLSAWVYVDDTYKMPFAFPLMGYGNTTQAPYAWPGAKNVQVAKAGVVVAPPLPVELRPVLASPACVPAASKAAGTACPAAAATPATGTATGTATATATSAPATQTN